jgi:HSP20 family protein
MTIIKWRPGRAGYRFDPFSEMQRLQHEMHRIYNTLTGTWEAVRPAGVYPHLNITEDEDNYYVRAELPGVDPEDIEITTQENDLIISGERKIPVEGENVSYHRRERKASSFRRITSLPTHIDSSKVAAVCKNGLLTITLPKAPEVKARQIEVKPV